MNRRAFVASSVIAASALGAITVRAQDDGTAEPETVDGDLSATPAADLPIYPGPIEDLLYQPEVAEGMAWDFEGLILSRNVAPKGQMLTVGLDNWHYRSKLFLRLASVPFMVAVLSNDDLSSFKAEPFARVVGVYVGAVAVYPALAGDIPLTTLIASVVEPVESPT